MADLSGEREAGNEPFAAEVVEVRNELLDTCSGHTWLGHPVIEARHQLRFGDRRQVVERLGADQSR